MNSKTAILTLCHGQYRVPLKTNGWKQMKYLSYLEYAVVEKDFLELVFYLASNATKRTTYSSLGKIIGIRHPETIKNYIEYICQTYLTFQLMKYSPSLKTQMLSPKKIYFIDNAIIRRIGFNATENIGINLENLLFIELKRRECEVLYYADKKECDFIVRKGIQVVQAYQVTVSMTNPETQKREINGLCEAMQAFGLTTGHIITMDEKETINLKNGNVINVVPAWEWMLG